MTATNIIRASRLESQNLLGLLHLHVARLIKLDLSIDVENELDELQTLLYQI